MATRLQLSQLKEPSIINSFFIVEDVTRRGEIEFNLPSPSTDPFLEWSINIDLQLFGRETPFSRIPLTL